MLELNVAIIIHWPTELLGSYSLTFINVLLPGLSEQEMDHYGMVQLYLVSMNHHLASNRAPMFVNTNRNFEQLINNIDQEITSWTVG